MQITISVPVLAAIVSYGILVTALVIAMVAAYDRQVREAREEVRKARRQVGGFIDHIQRLRSRMLEKGIEIEDIEEVQNDACV